MMYEGSWLMYFTFIPLWTEKCEQACANLKYACQGLYHSENDQNWMKSYGGAKALNARWSKVRAFEKK